MADGSDDPAEGEEAGNDGQGLRLARAGHPDPRTSAEAIAVDRPHSAWRAIDSGVQSDEIDGEHGRSPSFVHSYLRHGLPCVAVWGLYLVAFWPGILTEDSFEQWRDLVTGELRGYHSPVQTILNWLITRVWHSPAAVAMAQIIGLSLAYCAVVQECKRRNASRWGIRATTLAFAALPANGFLVVTLWKDVPYSIAILGSVALSLRLVRTRGNLDGAMAWMLAGTLTAVATIRHNGLPTVILSLAALCWSIRGSWRDVTRLVALVGGAVLLVYLGLFALVHVRPFHAAYRDQVILHQVAAALRPGTAFDQADFGTLGRIMPISTWLGRYQCHSVIPVLSAVLEHSPDPQYESMRPGLYRAWRHAWSGSPSVLARHHACVTGMIWNPFADFHLVAVEIVPNTYEMTTQPKVPAARRVLLGVLARTTTMPWKALVWGPPLHFYLLLAAIVYVLTKTRNRLAALPFVPPVAHSLVLLLVIPSAEYRLQYPVVLAGLLAPLIGHALVRADRS